MDTLVDEVEVPDRPSVPGLRFRGFRGPADYAGIAATNQAVWSKPHPAWTGVPAPPEAR
jgi:hypothetical protein